MKNFSTLIISLLMAFFQNVNSQNTAISKLNTYDLDDDNVSEPSGLAFDGEFLYTISDDSSLIYKYNTDGDFLESFDTDLEDLEGISTFGENTLLLAVESSNTLVVYNYEEDSTEEYSMDFENSDSSGNSGIEGVTYDPTNNVIYFLNEKNPGALIVADSKNFEVTNEYELDFAEDYSGAFFVSETNELWITSDDEGLVYRTTLTGEVIETIDPDIDVDDKLEGIAVDYENKLLFLVTDSGQNLIKYSFVPPVTLSNNSYELNSNSEVSLIKNENYSLSVTSTNKNLSSLKIYNTAGGLLVNQKANNVGNIEVNTQNIKNGIYIAVINNTKTIKFNL